ncbi:E3 ubiquitin protein ligase DRIP2 [Ananas comosus]|uniref:E3 ubiquitin protein ligase DRIP2 n=1 Tax=Ananas comosus TaxID=4615 RepID=A0A199W6V9_ANACO|nr:E3 ubiquitin protein ligase DRIP2 [Ananas comosus]
MERGGAAAAAAAAAEAAEAAVMVKREVIVARVTCPLCKRLLRDATTISECLHTFCKKCIFEKLSDEETDCCPVCNIDLGCTPIEKLRPDHSLQDIRSKIFPFKRRKVEAPEAVTLPLRRKEKSLSSLVVSTPKVSTPAGFTGRRTKAIPRRTSALRGLGPIVSESVKQEHENADRREEKSSSPDTMSKMAQNKRQATSNGEPSNHVNGSQLFAERSELWKPLNCLVEAANRTKSLKSGPQSPNIKDEQLNGPDTDGHIHRAKVREHSQKSKVQDGKNGSVFTPAATFRAKRAQGISRKRRERGASAHSLLGAAAAHGQRRFNPIWFSLIASFDQKGDPPLPQIPTNYLRIKDGNIPASFIKKYLVQKLNLSNEAEVEITCRGQLVEPTLTLQNLVEIWLRGGSTERVQAPVGTSAKDIVMVLTYGRSKSSLS